MPYLPEKIIDFHTHTFPAKISGRVIKELALKSHSLPYTDGSAAALADSAGEAGVTLSVNLPVMTSPGQVEKINRSLVEMQEEHEAMGILSFGGLHPEYEKVKEELQFLKSHGIRGIKLHPAYQSTDLTDIRMERIIGYASELDLIVLIHAGIDIGIPGHNFASVGMILQVLDEVAPKKFVLAHMGSWAGWDDVERDLAGAPLFMDTSFSLGKIEQNPEDTELPCRPANLSDEDFIRLTRKHGAEKVLFATDSPWASQKEYVLKFKEMELSDSEKDLIMYRNASALLGI